MRTPPYYEAGGSPERPVAVIGGPLSSLEDKLLTNESLNGEVEAYRTESIYRTYGLQSHTVTEIDAAKDYFDFLNSAIEIASDGSTDEDREVARVASSFAHNFCYLSKSESQQAIHGLAERHVEFLKQNPHNDVFFWVFARNAEKSQMYFAQKSVDDIHQTMGPMQGSVLTSDVNGGLAARLSTRSVENTKIVMIDDWSITGIQMQNNVANFIRQLRGDGLHEDWIHALEINLLVVRRDQIDNPNEMLNYTEQAWGIYPHIPVIGYYDAPAAAQLEGPMPSGGHASVDYGFESQLQTIRDYVARHKRGQDVYVPYLAAIERPYGYRS